MGPSDHKQRSPVTEAAVWLVVLAVIISVHLFGQNIFDEASTVWLAGLIIVFALLYYTVINHYFTDSERHYIKDIADVVFIGILSMLAKNYSVYFFSLFILPIAAAAFALETVNSLLVAIFSSIFVAANIAINTQSFADVRTVYLGAFQVTFLILLTFFTRALALQLRTEKSQRSTAQAQLAAVDKKLDDLEATEEEFVALTTHQLNTPLSIIRGYSSMLLNEDAGKLTKKQHLYVQEINQGSLRLAKLIKELLNITRLEEGSILKDRQLISIDKLIQQSLDHVSDRAQSNHVGIEVQQPKNKLAVSVNPLLFVQVFSDLIDNAIKYSDSGQTVTVSVKKAGNSVGILFKDRGIGIPATEQSRIFQRFYRATNSVDKDGQGTGLGLYLVRRIIKEYGGTITFNSEEGKGSTFMISLPLAEES